MKFQKKVEIIVTHKSVMYWTCVYYNFQSFFYFLCYWSFFKAVYTLGKGNLFPFPPVSGKAIV
jgi:hypothetical protein